MVHGDFGEVLLIRILKDRGMRQIRFILKRATDDLRLYDGARAGCSYRLHPAGLVSDTRGGRVVEWKSLNCGSIPAYWVGRFGSEWETRIP
jgi:hypothetical protein